MTPEQDTTVRTAERPESYPRGHAGSAGAGDGAQPPALAGSAASICVIAAHVQATRFWRAEAAQLAADRTGRGYRNCRGLVVDARRRADVARQAAATAELWDLPVGIVTGVRQEVTP